MRAPRVPGLANFFNAQDFAAKSAGSTVIFRHGRLPRNEETPVFRQLNERRMSRSAGDIYNHQTNQQTTYQLHYRASTCPLSVGVARSHRAVLSDVGRYATAERGVAANDCASVAHNFCSDRGLPATCAGITLSVRFETS